MNGDVVHRLGVMAWSAAAAVCGARAVHESGRARAARRRLALVLGGQGTRRGPWGRLREVCRAWTAARSRAVRDRWPPLAAGLSCLAVVGGVPGCFLGLVAAYAVWTWCRRRSARAAGTDDADMVARELPLAADLLAACLAAGAGPREAAEAVGGSLGGLVGDRLARAAAELRLGAEPAAAWGRLGALPGAYGLARCLERAQATGVPVVEPVTRLAAHHRAERARTATAGARRAGVLVTAPLGLCFLPAFLTVGVAPVLIGLAGGLLRGG